MNNSLGVFLWHWQTAQTTGGGKPRPYSPPNAFGLAHLLKLDPLEFRLLNYTERDPENGKPWSTKFLKECYQMGAERIGWSKRKLEPGTLRDGEWLVGYGMGVGTFGAGRRLSHASAQLLPNGTVLMQCAITDIGPGTGTVMTQIAADTLGLPPHKIRFEWGRSDFPATGTQGGSSTVNSVGPALPGPERETAYVGGYQQ